MFKKYFHSKKGQNTAEYAILISLVIAGIIAMQTYAQRALQARVRDGAIYMTGETDDIGTTQQYEPYYLDSDFHKTANNSTTKDLDVDDTGLLTDDEGTRTGNTTNTYNTATVDGTTGM